MKKNVLLTGATGGIGEAICNKLSKNYNLVVVSRNQEKLKNFMKDNQSIIKRITCDLKDSDQIIKMIEEVISENLNNIIDVNYYPTETTRRSNFLHRPIGIGVQGLADTYALMDFSFYSKDDNRSKELNKKILSKNFAIGNGFLLMKYVISLLILRKI